MSLLYMEDGSNVWAQAKKEYANASERNRVKPNQIAINYHLFMHAVIHLESWTANHSKSIAFINDFAINLQEIMPPIR